MVPEGKSARGLAQSKTLARVRVLKEIRWGRAVIDRRYRWPVVQNVCV
jgi:hypothetical protein